ncbi:hypothetical protein [Amycolatopsis sp. NPDC004169]|uniref:hypothetical protein n=1 Tax=Amycolatopsis sp. NPDC004169 TaxID=3154453 RepID=UPI0033B69FC5
MEPVFLATAVAAATSLIGTVVTAWARSRVSWQQARERARADHVRHLPPGSRLIDLGARGLAIEVGGSTPAESLTADGRR